MDGARRRAPHRPLRPSAISSPRSRRAQARALRRRMEEAAREGRALDDSTRRRKLRRRDRRFPRGSSAPSNTAASERMRHDTISARATTWGRTISSSSLSEARRLRCSGKRRHDRRRCLHRSPRGPRRSPRGPLPGSRQRGEPRTRWSRRVRKPEDDARGIDTVRKARTVPFDGVRCQPGCAWRTSVPSRRGSSRMASERDGCAARRPLMPTT